MQHVLPNWPPNMLRGRQQRNLQPWCSCSQGKARHATVWHINVIGRGFCMFHKACGTDGAGAVPRQFAKANFTYQLGPPPSPALAMSVAQQQLLVP